MSDRFDLEQEIMQCWSVVNDINMFAKNASTDSEDWKALARVYEVKFNQLFEHFEAMIKNGSIK